MLGQEWQGNNFQFSQYKKPKCECTKAITQMYLIWFVLEIKQISYIFRINYNFHEHLWYTPTTFLPSPNVHKIKCVRMLNGSWKCMYNII